MGLGESLSRPNNWFGMGHSLGGRKNRGGKPILGGIWGGKKGP